MAAMQLPEIHDHFSIARLSSGLADGSLSSEELVADCLSRIDADDQELRAWVHVDRERAIEQARAADERRAAGLRSGPLHGIPIGIKDIVDVAGVVTGAGSPWYARRSVAPADARLVAALRRAGAVIVGKTVTTEFACFDPPPTRNPWNEDRTPGGSSSGSAAAVAARHVPVAIGSQTGGSITRPASFCGVCGLKPTIGTVSTDGVVPVAKSLDHPGPIARTVDDLRRTLMALREDDPGCIDDCSTAEIPTLRIGWLQGFAEDRVTDVMQTEFRQALDRLRIAGVSVIPIDVPSGFDQLAGHHRRVMACEAAAWHRPHFSEFQAEYGPCVRQLIEEGLSASAADYLQSREFQADMSQAMNGLLNSAGLNALITPATTGPAPDRSTTGDPCMNAPWSFTGMPTVSFPVALDDDGMPLAVQLAGARNADWGLLDAASRCERILRTV